MALQKITANSIAANSVGLTQLNVTDGTNGQLLKTNGSGTLSFVDAGGGGAWNVISSTTVSSAVAQIEFTLSGYLDYAIVFRNPTPSSGWNHNRFFFSTNNGSSYSTNLSQIEVREPAWTSSSSRTGTSSQGFVETGEAENPSFISQNQIINGIIYLHNNASGVPKTGIYDTMDFDGRYGVMHEQGAYSIDESSVINKIKYMLTGNGTTNIISGTFTLYGIATS